ncbi:TonB-dependent receptor [Sphingomonas panacis]|uniref:TonB-dependent receptor n=1 Tax=Sphingomonas panacis TaxID=1560345 RepID=A0A1B3Z9E3_9SPHN|nr:TonB-dependent receptor [Sphingomonas panacis]AOH84029.1 TonB-dependent receptor [Sphingomonas panacis]
MKFGAGAVASLLLASAAFLPALAEAQSAPASEPAPATDQQPETSDIIVTAQKREESLSSVPISIQAIGTKRLDQLNISNFNQYTQLLPSVSFQTTQPGSTTVYMRGVASGGDGNHSGSLPSVGFYLDEQPITTIGGTLDVHIYDIARIESLAGPQGTLYGASSEAGTVRIITNKPDLSHFYGRVDGEVNTVAHGGVGGKVEGMINAPLNAIMALRVSGFYERDAGYIDNVAGCRSYLPEPTTNACTPTNGGIVVNNKAFVKKDYNESDLWGGRAALKIDLDDSWTVTPTVLYQEAKYHGAYAMDASVGDLKVQHFFPEYRHDRFIQAALTIQGKVGNWDLTYAGAYLDRQDQQSSDYTDYAEAYDRLYSSVGGNAGYFYFHDKSGNTIDPRQNILGSDHFKKMSQELRVASPQDERFRVVSGLFYQRQSNLIHQDYRVDGLAPELSVNGHPGTLWLTQQHRVDKDYAIFGEAAFDILPTLTLTAGGRGFIYDNSLIGFYGFGRNPGDGYTETPYNASGSSKTGVAACFTSSGQRLRDALNAGVTNPTLAPAAVAGGPCTNLGNYVIGEGITPVKASGQGFTHKLNLTWKPSKDFLLYGTWSRGFRPGGINRRADQAPYEPDFLTNYEIGAKTTLLGGKLHINAAIYQQDWKKFQFSFLGQNSFTIINNGPNARIRGIEADANLTVGGLTLTAAGAYTDAKIRQNLCGADDPNPKCDGVEGDYVAAPAGTRMPITPRFKINGTARYTVPVGVAKVYGQVLVAHQSSASSDIRLVAFGPTGEEYNPAQSLGRLKQYTTGDLALGAEWPAFSLEVFAQNVWDERAQLSRFAECGTCSQRPYVVTSTPRTIGIRGGMKF